MKTKPKITIDNHLFRKLGTELNFDIVKFQPLEHIQKIYNNQDYVYCFNWHNAHFCKFLELYEQDLYDIGVNGDLDLNITNVEEFRFINEDFSDEEHQVYRQNKRVIDNFSIFGPKKINFESGSAYTKDYFALCFKNLTITADSVNLDFYNSTYIEKIKIVTPSFDNDWHLNLNNLPNLEILDLSSTSDFYIDYTRHNDFRSIFCLNIPDDCQIIFHPHATFKIRTEAPTIVQLVDQLFDNQKDSYSNDRFILKDQALVLSNFFPVIGNKITITKKQLRDKLIDLLVSSNSSDAKQVLTLLQIDWNDYD